MIFNKKNKSNKKTKKKEIPKLPNEEKIKTKRKNSNPKKTSEVKKITKTKQKTNSNTKNKGIKKSLPKETNTRKKITKSKIANNKSEKKLIANDKTETLLLGKVNKKEFYYPKENLKKHFIALGASGSGKTVLSKVVLEEAALAGIPSIVVDVQGDLSALALMGDEESIAEHDLDIETLQKFREEVEVTIFTPISSKGIPLCINPLQLSETNVSEEEIIPILHSIASSFSKLLGYNLSNDKGKFAEAIMYSVLKYSFEKKDPIKTFNTLTSLIKNPPKELAEEINGFVSDDKEISTLIRKIKFLSVGEKKLLFQLGVPLDINLLLGKQKNKIKNNKSNNKTHMSIIYMNTLPDQEEKEFFLAALTTKLYQWMLDNPSKKLQALYMIDEIAPFIPAGAKKPMPKDILKLLFKQARKYGVSCVIATQNPGDIDYKAFAQFGTWAMGRLTLKQDIKKVDQALSSIAGSKGVEKTLPKLQPGEFVLFSPDISKELLELKARWLYTKHQTLDEEDVKESMDSQRNKFEKLFLKEDSEIENDYEETDETSDVDEIDEIENDKKNNHSKTKKQKNNYEQEEFEDDQETNTTKNKENLVKKLDLKDKNSILCLANELDEELIREIARKKKKKSFFGADEQVVSIKKEYYPYLETKIRTVKKRFFKTIEEERILFFDGITGEVIVVNPKKHIRKPRSRKLLSCSENQLILAKTVMKNKKPLSISEIAMKTGLDERTTSKNLKELANEGILTFYREGKYKFFKALVSFKDDLDTMDSNEIETKKCRKNNIFVRKENISINEIVRFVRTWFKNSQVLEVRTIHVPFYDVVYSKKNKERVLTINAVTKEKSE